MQLTSSLDLCFGVWRLSPNCIKLIILNYASLWQFKEKIMEKWFISSNTIIIESSNKCIRQFFIYSKENREHVITNIWKINWTSHSENYLVIGLRFYYKHLVILDIDPSQAEGIVGKEWESLERTRKILLTKY